MTMKPWAARALRRFVGTAMMLVGGQACIHRLLFASPEFPSHRVDRVVVEADEFVYEIRDPAALRRIVAFVRGPKEREPKRHPDYIHYPNGFRRASFYREGQATVRMVWAGRAIIFPVAHDQNVWYYLTADEGARLQRLMADPGR